MIKYPSALKGILACIFMILNPGCSDFDAEDTIIEAALSPSRKMKATVIEYNGILTGSHIVFLHSAKKKHRAGEAVIAISDGSAPSVKFINDTTLEVWLFRGSKHNQLKESQGIKIVYE